MSEAKPVKSRVPGIWKGNSEKMATEPIKHNWLGSAIFEKNTFQVAVGFHMLENY